MSSFETLTLPLVGRVCRSLPRQDADCLLIADGADINARSDPALQGDGETRYPPLFALGLIPQ